LIDMTGNVWEWTSSLYKPYRYDASDGREELITGDDRRVVRGGSWRFSQVYARAACRFRSLPDDRLNSLGFRVVCSSPILP
jgi:formylglycine-generating enzyme required for sulfatase activity